MFNHTPTKGPRRQPPAPPTALLLGWAEAAETVLGEDVLLTPGERRPARGIGPRAARRWGGGAGLREREEPHDRGRSACPRTGGEAWPSAVAESNIFFLRTMLSQCERIFPADFAMQRRHEVRPSLPPSSLTRDG